MNHRAHHSKNILLMKPASNSKLEFGSIITFNYIDEHNRPTKPLVLVLNPHYQGNLHGIKLDEVSPTKLQEIVNVVDLWYSKKLNELMRLRLPLLKVNVGSPKQFYNTKMKVLLESKVPKLEVYREYHTNKMRSVQLVDYKFDLQIKREREKRRQKLREYKKLLQQQRKLGKSK